MITVWSLTRKNLLDSIPAEERFLAKTWWQNCPDEVKEFWPLTDILALYRFQKDAERIILPGVKEMSKRCWICDENTTHSFAATVWHFRPIDWEQRGYIRGNFHTFGFWGGLRANVTLMFPFLNTLMNWRHRKSRLDIPQ